MKYVLGIESTAHTFGVAVLSYDDEKEFLPEKVIIHSNEKDSYTTESGGMIPIEVRNHHKKCAPQVYKKALQSANIQETDISAIAFSASPGLAPCLLEGMGFAKKTAQNLDIPLIPINHCVAHLEVGELTGARDPVLLYASGANTQIIAYEAGRYRVFGETLDIGVGNFIDTIARSAGLGFPGGPKIQEIAKKATNKENPLQLPYVVKGMDMSFSGIQTKMRALLEKEPLENLAYALQETVFAMLVEVSERALAHTGKKELLLGGGVACNTRLQEMCKIMCKDRGAKYFCPPNNLLVDNAAMIAYTGIKKLSTQEKILSLEEIDINPRERTDDVEVTWK